MKPNDCPHWDANASNHTQGTTPFRGIHLTPSASYGAARSASTGGLHFNHPIRSLFMPQNLISIGLSDADYAEIDAALATLEHHFTTLLDLSADARRTLTKMGDKSEAFCRQALIALDQNRQVLPPGLDLAEAQHDLLHFDRLRARGARLHVLQGKVDDTVTAGPWQRRDDGIARGLRLVEGAGPGFGPGGSASGHGLPLCAPQQQACGGRARGSARQGRRSVNH